MIKNLIFLTTILLFCSQITFGQTKTENKKGTKGMATGDYKPNRQETPPKTKVTYESRNYQNDCYKSFVFIVKNYGYNKDGKFYSWGVSVKNNYSKAVQLKYKLIVGNDNNQNGTLTYYIKPGETYSNDFGTAKAIIVNNNSDQYKIEVSEVCFEGQDCRKNGYLDCNGRQSNANSTNSKSETKEDAVENITPASNVFDKNSSYETHRNHIKDLLVSAGFKFVSFEGDNSARYIFEEFRVSYSPKFTPPYYVRNLHFDNIKSRATYIKLYKLMGCESSSDGRKCTKFATERSGSDNWFDVGIE